MQNSLVTQFNCGDLVPIEQLIKAINAQIQSHYNMRVQAPRRGWGWGALAPPLFWLRTDNLCLIDIANEFTALNDNRSDFLPFCLLSLA